MRQDPSRARHRHRLSAATLVTAFIALAGLLPLTVGDADTAAAAPSAGYTASLIPTGQETFWVAVNPVSNTVYFGDGTNELTVVNGATNTVTTTIPLSAPPAGVAVDPVTGTVYVAITPDTSTIAPTVDVISGATNTVTDTITLPPMSSANAVAVDSLTDRIYVADANESSVAVIDGTTNNVIATVSTGSGSSPFRLAVDEDTDVVWATNISNDVVAISGQSDTVIKTVNLGESLLESVAVDPVSDTIYVASEDSGVTVINGATGAVRTTIAVAAPLAVAVDHGSGTVFASSYFGTSGSGTTWVINEASNTIADTIGRGGLQVAVNTTTGAAFEAAFDAQKNAAWVLTPSTSNAMSPVIKSTSATFTVGIADSFTIDGSALPAATYSEVGSLPSGVALSPSGTLSGTPAAGTAGSYPIELTASNGIAPDYSQAFTLTVNPLVPPVIISADQAQFTVQVPNAFGVQATGTPPTFTESGRLPAGVTFSSAGQLSGIPPADAVGSYPITITATNPGGSAIQAFTLTVALPSASGLEPAVLNSSSGALAVYSVRSDGNVWADDQPAGGGAFGGWQQLPTAGAVLTGTPAVVQAANGAISVYARTTTEKLMEASEATPGGAFGSWSQIGTATNVTGDPVALTAANGAVAIYATDFAGALEGISQSAPGGLFGSWQVLSPADEFTGRPSVLMTSGGLVAIYARTTTGIILATSQHVKFGPFDPWAQIGSTIGLASDPVALIAANGAVAIYATDSAGVVDGISQSVAFGPFGSWQALSPADGFTGTPSVLLTSGGLVAMYARTTAGTLLATSQHARNGPFSPWSQIGTATNLASDPDALITAAGTVAIFAADSAGGVSWISQSAPFGPFGTWTAL